jgi:SAM-dependent MidA family methyltransferase
MRAALYDESGGYYTTSDRQFGRDGDFYTAAQVHEVFGALLAEEFSAIDRALGRPPAFTIVELGPGRGEFARDALSAIRAHHADLFARLKYVCCEISPALRRTQQQLLADFPTTVDWTHDADDLALFGPIEGVFFANEFFDALPVHVVEQRDAELLELYVATGDDGRCHWQTGPLSHPDLGIIWKRAGAPLANGQRAEISPDSIEWLNRIGRSLKRGRLIAIDYGDIAVRLYTPDRTQGTLRAFRRHRIEDDPLSDAGKQDITASVNFSALMEYGRDFGLEALSFVRLTDYLIGLGLLERAAQLAANAGDENPGALQRRLALKQMFVPQGISGGFCVLTMEKRSP